MFERFLNELRAHSARYTRLYLTGFVMGTADLIPGVSGGTIAFLSGIYSDLLNAIKTMSGPFLKLFLRGSFRSSFQLVPFRFLIPLGLGLFTAVLSLAKLLAHLLQTYPVFVWSFFFGLVLASVWAVKGRVRVWNRANLIALSLSAIGAFILVGAIPTETPDGALFIFLSGAIAICAMILPGISGSFILLLLGKYHQVLEALNARDLFTIGVFISGCIVGLGLFARFLSWLLSRFHDITVAILTGFMLGSVRKLWPWREVLLTRINSKGVEVPLHEMNILPPAFDSTVIAALMLALFGAALVLWMERLHVTDETLPEDEGA